MSEMSMPEGVIAGGWSYVVAGYGLTALVFLGYAWNLWRRRGASEQHGESGE